MPNPERKRGFPSRQNVRFTLELGMIQTIKRTAHAQRRLLEFGFEVKHNFLN
jgi:hypothetical protein